MLLSTRGKLLQGEHRYDRVTPPCPPAGAVIRRKKTVLFNIVPCTMLKVFLPTSVFKRILSTSPHFGRCSVSALHFSRQILWQETCPWPCIPSCFSFSASLRNFFVFPLAREKYSHIPCINLSFPNILHSLPRCAFFSATALPLPSLQRRQALPLTQIDRVRLLYIIDNYRSKLRALSLQ